jgi:hypothetical protein
MPNPHTVEATPALLPSLDYTRPGLCITSQSLVPAGRVAGRSPLKRESERTWSAAVIVDGKPAK